MRRAARVDANQSEIVQALRDIGATVQPLHTVGKGCPDLLVGYRGNNFILELKFGRGGMTKDEMKFMDEWRGQYAVVRSKEQAVELVSA